MSAWYPTVDRSTPSRLIHDHSLRSSEPFIEFVAAGGEQEHLEATLFGVEGAIGGEGDASRPGLLDSADRGTLLIHQVASVPLGVQVQLEATLDRGAFRRSGGVREVPIDFRLVATTTDDPEVAMEQGRLSPELFYRLKAMELAVPPLRDLDRDDFVRAVHRTLKRMGPGMSGVPRGLSEAALERMVAHNWAGNFRELRHVLDRAALLARGLDEIGLEHLPSEFRARPGPFDRRHTPLTMEEVERMHIERTLKHHAGNRTRSAEELGISRATLISKIKKYAIPL